MTDRNPDWHCEHCGKYLFSTYATDPIPPEDQRVCEVCKVTITHED